jgi:predicted DCC family thiol-disulfide oxidoreductase YuxK
MVTMHGLIFIFLTIPDTPIAVLLLHVLLFQPRWLPPRTFAGARPVLFVDGVCVLCNRFANFVLAEDETGTMAIAALQGETARQHLAAADREGVSYIVVSHAGGVLRRSDAVLFVMDSIGGMFRLLAWAGRAVPRRLRDSVYAWVATHRYAWFGQLDACTLPQAADGDRVLD